ncbi:MAG: Tryptophan 2,3-dioxygenase [Symbiobacteriaceae bacterium]|jgi:tryptophan 2,3-dioxygenase|nr:Tryptophan 2,3-dioxygenase [Symbiobacteriaceae bacterium]
MGITYGSALNIEQLLALQKPFSADPVHDELQYVIIHQCSELWFKLLLHEVDEVVKLLGAGDCRQAARLLRRCVQIVGVIDQGFSLMETMPAYEYARFRPNLMGGSGFQSAQFREVELALGYQRELPLEQPAFTEAERARLGARRRGPSLWDAFVGAMRQCGYAMPDRAPGGGADDGGVAGAGPGAAARPDLLALRTMYQSGAHPDLRDVSEELVALDNAMLMWRTHHAAMAERAIGSKVGTGGQGVAYLYRSARGRCYPELFEVRTLL